ncbi:hypothetical protein SAMN04487819_10713 [Actinopolyspora alba]|uniref:Uncharacterized protein n=1 Tax=Actinopolyspora alba TaxID=673379 RepID=A0A1I1XAL5_9ACTN|nr:hypothetical protein [Actinopolyspora alba]SFE04397.1 hypothetical protein SAMN04487819_10713 [Actinopolyspora alba]
MTSQEVSNPENTSNEQAELMKHGERVADGAAVGSAVYGTADARCTGSVYVGDRVLSGLTPGQLRELAAQAATSADAAGADRHSVILQNDPEIRQLYRESTTLCGSEANVELLQDPDLGPVGYIDVNRREALTSLSVDEMLSLSAHLAQMALVAHREVNR